MAFCAYHFYTNFRITLRARCYIFVDVLVFYITDALILLKWKPPGERVSALKGASFYSYDCLFNQADLSTLAVLNAVTVFDV